MKKIIAFAGSNNPDSIRERLVKYMIEEKLEKTVLKLLQEQPTAQEN